MKKVTLVFLAVTVLFLGFMLFSWLKGFSDTKVAFLDVGQGDAILISQGSNQILIDGGRSGKVLLDRLGEYIPFWDRSIETVIATHPDEDHIGGLVDLVKTYKVGALVGTKKQNDSGTLLALQDESRKRGVPGIEAFSGMTMAFPGGSVLEVVYPGVSYADDIAKDTNGSSIVAKFSAPSGEAFLFTGDLPSDKEMSLPVGHIDVLKAGHHGSKYSSSAEFLEKIRPKSVVLSVGSDNRYGHPAPETIDRLKKYTSQIFRTDVQGTVVYQCPASGEGGCAVTVDKN